MRGRLECRPRRRSAPQTRCDDEDCAAELPPHALLFATWSPVRQERITQIREAPRVVGLCQAVLDRFLLRVSTVEQTSFGPIRVRRFWTVRWADAVALRQRPHALLTR